MHPINAIMMTRMLTHNSGLESGMVSCVDSSSVMDPYRTLKVQPGASKSEEQQRRRCLNLTGFFFSFTVSCSASSDVFNFRRSTQLSLRKLDGLFFSGKPLAFSTP
ncbi:hypothetical protein ACFX13_001180 [Malus domestica]